MISTILTNKSIWKVLILFSYAPGAGYRWSDLKQHTALQIKSLKLALEILEFHKILKKEKMIYQIDFSTKLSNSILNIIEDEKKRLNYPNYNLFIALNTMMELLQKRKEINKIYLFGSHAKKKASINSDIDIAIITDNINLDFTKELIELEEKHGYKFEFHTHQFGNDLLSKEIKTHGVKIV